MSAKVVVAGHVTLDGYGERLLPGGSAYYAAAAHRALGARTRVVTAAAGDFPRSALAGSGVVWIDAAATSRWTNRYGVGGGRTQYVEATSAPIPASALPATWAGADLLHLAPVLNELDLVAWVGAARARFVGIGVQGWVRAVDAAGAVIQPRWDVDASGLRGVGAASLGEDDLAGQGDLLDRLASAVPVVAFTHGARGCTLLLRGRSVEVGAFATHEVDPTGAGDVFAAAFFLALAQGRDPVAAARLGAGAASVVVEGRAGETLGRVAEAYGRAARIP